MHKLDDLKTMQALDKEDMYRHIAGLPDQFEHAWQESKKLVLPSNYIRLSNVVLLGMGGSAIGASLLKSLLLPMEKVPVTVVRDYTLPAYVNHETMVIAISYSGATEEVLRTFTEASQRGAKLIALSTGNELERLASRFRSPFLQMTYSSEPRAALGFAFVPLVTIFSKVGLLEFSNADMEEALTRMRTLAASLAREEPFSNNQAKRLAERLVDRIVIAMGAGPLSEVARRWKNQLNENAKHASFVDVFPELCHNTIMGFANPKNLSNNLFVLLFPSRFDHPRNKLRIQLFASFLDRKHIEHEVIEIKDPASALSEMAALIILGDFTSYYLAMLNGQNPSVISEIDWLKGELAKHSG